MVNVTGIDELIRAIEEMMARVKKAGDAIEKNGQDEDAESSIREELSLRSKPRLVPLMDKDTAKAAAQNDAVTKATMLGEDLGDYIAGK